ncbi:asparagine synthase-related protein [Reyranella sp.]|uniref:asparagine synthase-related protein n=1 Tax=Reyranella sp. TaxID=1929291 RepID=UPI001206DEBD|nr:asparagine synthase-related protein [Reyranella sp.]TAJ83628.1 MAG: hypothetical protein EPO50_22580 [Reyranella sp.]
MIYDTSGRPVDRQALSRAGLTVESPTGAPQLVFIHSSETFDGEWRGCASLQGKYWIAGRIRLDARRDLAARLADRRVEPASSLTDGALCLQAYAAWGDRCVEHLAGDFAFVLWDGERRRLLAARDHLGVRTLFHAQKGGVLVVGDSLDWIVTTPLTTGFIDCDHDEQWIADFLTAGFSLDVERTVYRQVRRLAPAHLLDVADGAVTTRRYWHLEIGEPLHLGSGRAYTERFLELMSHAVADRLPGGRVGISMSGGIDSTTLAACTTAATGDPSRVVAECTHFERLMPDDEASFATLAAKRLGIELHIKAIDDFIYDPDWRSQRGGAEPSPNIVARHPDRLMALEQARRAPIWFFGEGPDNALAFERGAYFSWLARRGEWLRLGQAALLYLKAKGVGGWGQTVRRYTGQGESSPVGPDLPGWLDRGLAERLDQGARLGRLGNSGGSSHPWHPQAVASFADPIWPALFDSFDSDETLAPMVWRHPYLDLRVIGFLLSVPPVPWAREKLLMREAMRGRLPDAVLARRKTPLAGAPLADLVATHGLPTLSNPSQLACYVDTRALPREVPSGPAFERLINVFALDHWLTQQSGTAPIAGAWRGR